MSMGTALIRYACWLGVAGALSATAASAQSGGQSAAQASGRAEAEVVVAIRAGPLADLSFGSITIGSSGEGSIVVAADGSPPRYVNAARSGCSGQTECEAHRARFAVSGDPDRSYRVALPGAIVATGRMTGVGLPVTDLAVRSQNDSAASGEGRLDRTGRDVFFVGGTLRIPPGTRPDVFRAELSVIVNYN